MLCLLCYRRQHTDSTCTHSSKLALPDDTHSSASFALPSGGFCACFGINGDTTPENCAAYGGTFCGTTTTTTTATTTTTSYTGPTTTNTGGAGAEIDISAMPWEEFPGPPDGVGWSRAGPESNSARRWPYRRPINIVLCALCVRSDPPGGGEDVWEDYVRLTSLYLSVCQVEIGYKFDADVDNNRKDAFRQAVEIWRAAGKGREPDQVLIERCVEARLRISTESGLNLCQLHRTGESQWRQALP